jgi:deoxyribodipyrimidine photo-lyase
MAANAAAFAAAGVTYYPYVEPPPGAGPRPARRAGRARRGDGHRPAARLLPAAHGRRGRAPRRAPRAGRRRRPVAARRSRPRLRHRRRVPLALAEAARRAPGDAGRDAAGQAAAERARRHHPRGDPAPLAGRRRRAARRLRPRSPADRSPGPPGRLPRRDRRRRGHARGLHPRRPAPLRRRAQPALSPYLHFGHLGAHAVAQAVWRTADWTPAEIADRRATGSRDGWWGLPRAAEAFMDELFTWRELGYGFCHHRADYDRYESLPPWARNTLDAHAGDPRPHRYTLAELEAAATHDPLWNAAQRQLVARAASTTTCACCGARRSSSGAPTPRAALAALIDLNNQLRRRRPRPQLLQRHLLDAGPLRPTVGPRAPDLRHRSLHVSDNTARKLQVKPYLARWSAQPALL